MEKLTKKTIKKIRELHQKKYRKIYKQFLISGLLSVEEAINSNYDIAEIYYTTSIVEKKNIDTIFKLAQKKNIPLYNIHHTDVKKVSTEISPQGIIAIVNEREFTFTDLNDNILILDEIKDPGNLGTIFRIADWFGLGGLILLDGTVDPLNPKVVQSSMGSIFHLPFVIEKSYDKIIEHCKNNSLQILISNLHSGKNLQEINVEKKFALVIGNESRGISDIWNDYNFQNVYLKRLGKAESLNAGVATASMLSVMLYK
ncbi:MAG: RNA methyltransferase [Candidatus Marinimicrobia bacterium]|nr:RNA methyltransferase [Candidatus Neomarinimicrobiota bacterium]